MRFIHCADIHADSKMGTHLTSDQAATRRKEIVNTFEKMVKYAADNDVTAIIIAGDLFDTKTSQQKNIKRRIAHIVKENSGIDFLYLRGNHDEDADFTEGDSLPNLKYFCKDSWEKYSYGNVDIYGREFSDTIPASVYSQLKCDESRVNIVTCHGQTADYNTKNDAPDISLTSLKNHGIDYLALGHIHSYRQEKLDTRGVWCYSGCLEGRGFDECGKKGFVLIDVEGAKVSSQFIPFAARTIQEVSVELEPVMTYEQILSSIENKLKDTSCNDIVQVILTGEVEEDTQVEPDSYEAALAGNYFCFRVKDKTRTKIDYEKYANDVSLKGAFISLVKNQEGLSEEDKAKVIMAGINALAGRL
ncbi:MAG: metallophosphoesterase [Treponema sp.]|nr:metallophosphoesterase [Treponema sp.]